MEAKELRLGNLVKDKEGNIIEVESIADVGINIYNGAFGNDSLGIEATYGFYDIEPIPLTEEWLLKLGFTKNGMQNGYVIIDGKLRLDYLDNVYYPRYVEYVHLMQNIYFFYTGEELVIK